MNAQVGLSYDELMDKAIIAKYMKLYNLTAREALDLASLDVPEDAILSSLPPPPPPSVVPLQPPTQALPPTSKVPPGLYLLRLASGHCWLAVSHDDHQIRNRSLEATRSLYTNQLILAAIDELPPGLREKGCSVERICDAVEPLDREKIYTEQENRFPGYFIKTRIAIKNVK